ncbi:MAG: transcriptional regulator [Spirochaetes bacterium GWD1_61_31]|nr:MAG: transcriptional regulator [Spirochaetes bacterium GWB1_60_80]OHD28538.1 MAG: transcriptional regulator [Spirochaetes bacterium GWC1_61_12]OHD42202.1 MAG: transcriptional regulator [Spirochaetes bacterium GWD1_61_31]OHD44532.1 MAG: transcriptional regulator [Spirochaetes bacterium GWE1_60_18]OHD59316.1 MAG: transcriptional regulator [Spirochaetes bacterium GWF1_60_12]HAP43187.1 transcriptional regulator [Spirochaetaceae bacterium]
MSLKILIADDEPNIRAGIAEYLRMEGYDTCLAADGNEAIAETDRGEVDLVITDLKMGKISGMDVLRHVVGHYPSLPVIILTGHGTVEDAVAAMRDGAYDFITKPVNLAHLALLAKRALDRRALAQRNQELLQEIETGKKTSSIIGRSAAIKSIFERIRKVAPTKAGVLITGESGVGKELVADALHNLSERADKPFIKVHCAALAESLLESELFGHEKGAFTGAANAKKGRFEMANGGTLFLDEIGEINQSVQVKILRVLQEHSFERVGGERTLETDVRVISATNRDLLAEIKKGSFREDLFYRLNVVNIDVPPLRERKDDIPILASAFLQEFAADNNKRIDGFDAKARTALYNYGWPGNIRELRNCMESAVVLTSGNIITLDDLPPALRGSEESGGIRLSLGIRLDAAERIIIGDTLAANEGNKSRTAEILGISRKTLYQKLRDYGLEADEE